MSVSRCTLARIRFAKPRLARALTTIRAPTGARIDIPPPDAALGPYRKCIEYDGLLYTSTHFGVDSKNVVVKGKVGAGVSPEDAKQLARGAGLRILSTVNEHLSGDLSRVQQVVKLTGLVNGAEDFAAHGGVINGCSELLVEAFGPDAGAGARVCSGAGSLGCAVTCDVVLKVRPKCE